ncbi:TPA: hypothetical protein N0F65_003651 [Lagenidium giganteum]|uniref:J domain-containing protein n=1 Tax=Lagenidium giganteum TaxID=4803 RepID=A0AAV2YHI9_9STRA|nr:TPA: hypothetical protein N0F65_003651 [Lagenidium giganteum]
MADPRRHDDERFWRQLERDYYALLGVARDASAEEIRSKYLALSRAFHPDRRRQQKDDELVALANTQYPILDHAYKVLSDPMRRYVYDIYGEKGVLALEQDATLQNAVGAHLKTTDEMQRYVEEVMRRMNQHALEAQFSSFSEMSMHVDASDFVHAPMRGLRSLFDRGNRYIDRTEMTIHQRTSFPLSRSTNLTLGGYMYDKHGLGVGSFTAQLAYTSFDPSVPSVTVATELGWTPKVHCQISQPVSPYTVFMLIPEVDDHGFDFSMGANRLLTPKLHGAMMWSTRDGLSASLNSDTDRYRASTAVAVGKAGPTLSAQYRHSFTPASAAKASIRANLINGISLTVGASKEVSRRTRLALGVLMERTGVTLRLGFTRGSVRFVMPIFISPFSVQSAFSTFCGATVPFFVSALVSQLVKPAHERRRRREIEQRNEVRANFLANARDCAMAQQQLMARYAEEKLAKEKQVPQNKGLVILLARYGKNPTSPDPVERRTDAVVLPQMGHDDDDDDNDQNAERAARADRDDNLSGALEQWVDVTIPLRFFVNDSSLTLHGSSKAGLLGFYNPCAGQTVDGKNELPTPKLYVRYAYDGLVFEATFDDNQTVNLPSRYAQAMGSAGSVY